VLAFQPPDVEEALNKKDKDKLTDVII